MVNKYISRNRFFSDPVEILLTAVSFGNECMLEPFYSEEGSCSRDVLLVTVDVFTDLKTSVFPDQLKSPFAENNFY